MFQVPVDYVERSPSQLSAEWAAKFGRGFLPDDAIGRMESRYDAHRARQPEATYRQRLEPWVGSYQWCLTRLNPYTHWNDVPQARRGVRERSLPPFRFREFKAGFARSPGTPRDLLCRSYLLIFFPLIFQSFGSKKLDHTLPAMFQPTFIANQARRGMKMATRARSTLWAGLAFAVCVVCAPASAQTGLGIVRGTVMDPSGAAVPQAQVTLINAGTGIAQRVTTSAVGDFYFGHIRTGDYSLTVVKSGFERWVGTFIVRVGQTVSVNPRLAVGSTTQTVQVTGAAPLVNATSMTISDIKDYEQIHQLPLNNRSIESLFDLTPGVEGGDPSDQAMQDLRASMA